MKRYSIAIQGVIDDCYSNEAWKVYKSIGKVSVNYLWGVPSPDILVNKLEKIDKKLLNSLPCLKIIAQPTTGLDNIDLKECKKRKIHVISLKGETKFLKTIPATAEHTIALMLSLMRNIPRAFESVLAGEWDRESFKGRELRGKTLGIIGYGRVGKQVTKIAKGFGMYVIALDNKGVSTGEESFLTDNYLTKLVMNSDIISLHIPLQNNDGFFGKWLFDLMKKGSYFINTARGDIINEQALLETLKSGKLAGAALDVVQNEPDVNKNLIDYALDNDNLILTPHISGATFQSMEATETFISQKVKEYVATIKKK